MIFRIILFFTALTCNHAIAAQSLTGSWYGKADVMVSGASSNYLTELALKQKGDEVEGIFGYYFKDSYQSFFIRGNYDAGTRQVSIRNLPLLFYGSSTRTGIECPMHFQATFMVSKVSSTLKGVFYTDDKYKYTCPQLRVNMIRDTAENTDSTLKQMVAGKKFWSPHEEDYVVSGYSLKTTDTPPVAYTTVSTGSGVASPAEKANDALITEFGKRNNIYEKDIVIYNDSVLVSFYDNGDIDDDTISVFLNKRPILVRRGLTSRALNIYIGLDSAVEVNELSMFADNLGKFPPNTALMVISDGQKRYELYLSASLKQNASVRLRRAGKLN
ncbi:MAG: hypothetical protein J7497_06745 [Chitinophagaceae bacterium]|nr:hypothetical protein [Chitinophagaceae bacterium]